MPRAPREHPDSRRRHILLAAHRCFGRRGFHEATMQDVADEAGLSVGTLYGYFRGKESLIQGLAEWGREQKRGMLAELARGEGADAVAEALAEIVGFLAGEGAERAARVDVRLWGEALGQGALLPVVRGGLERLVEPLASYVEGERAAGRIRGDVEPGASARVLVAVLVGLELQKALEPELDVGACAREVVRLVEALRPPG